MVQIWRTIPFTGLTLRGYSLFLIAMTSAVLGKAFGAPALIQSGFFFFILLLIAWAIRLSQGKLRAAHREPAYFTSAGEEVLAEVGLSGKAHGEVSVFLPPQLGGAKRFRLSEKSREHVFSYAVRPARRGQVALGPLFLQHASLFGLTKAEHKVGESVMLSVLPKVERLEALPPFSHEGRSATAFTRHRLYEGGGTVRPYRPGDRLKLLHWASSAKLGELVIREGETYAPDSYVMMVALPPGAPDPSPEAETMLEAAASIGAYLAGRRLRIRLLCNCAPALDIAADFRQQSYVAGLAALAGIDTKKTSSADLLLSQAFKGALTSGVIVIAGSGYPLAFERIAGLARRGTPVLTLLTVSSTFAHSRPALHENSPLLEAKLRAAGVHVASLKAGESLQKALGTTLLRAGGWGA